MSAFGVSPARARLAAFAVSGAMAGVAGVLMDYAQQNVVPGTYDIEASMIVFLAVALAGMTSVSFGVFGAMALEASVVFGPRLYDLFHSSTITSVMPLLLTGPLLIINAYFYPSGSAEAGFQTRDKLLRKVAARHHVEVPSLIADRAVPTPLPAMATVLDRAAEG